MKKYLSSWSVLSLSLFGSLGFISLTSLPSHAGLKIKLDATVSADNHYGLFVGNDDASELLFIGRNEKGAFHIPDTQPPVPNEVPDHPLFFNWEGAEAWSKNFSPRYKNFYAVVWRDEAVKDMFVGQFHLTFTCITGDCFNPITTTTHLSILSDQTWEFAISQDPNPGDFGDVPSLAELHEEVLSANTNNKWMSAVSLGTNDGTTLPWKRIFGISPVADFLDASAPNNSYLIIKTAFSCPDCPPRPSECIPEPLTILGSITAISLGIFFKSKI